MVVSLEESRGTGGIALDGENWCELLHGRLIVTPDRTSKEEKKKAYGFISRQAHPINIVLMALCR